MHILHNLYHANYNFLQALKNLQCFNFINHIQHIINLFMLITNILLKLKTTLHFTSKHPSELMLQPSTYALDRRFYRSISHLLFHSKHSIFSKNVLFKKYTLQGNYLPRTYTSISIKKNKWLDKISAGKMVNILWNEAELLGLTFKLS